MSDTDFSSYITRFDFINMKLQYFQGADWYDVPAGGGSGLNQLTGDVTAGPGSGSQVATLTNGVVTNAKLTSGIYSSITGLGTQAQDLNLGTNSLLNVNTLTGRSGTSNFTISTNSGTYNWIFSGSTGLLTTPGGIDTSGNFVRNIANPLLAQDAATKNYVDTAIAGVPSGITQLTGDVTAGPGSGSQAATLADTAVTPGNYTYASLIVDSKGRLTSASSGTPVTSIHADANSNLTGDVQLISGTNVTLSQVGQAITINSTGGSAPTPNVVTGGFTGQSSTSAATWTATGSTVTITPSSNTAHILVMASGIVQVTANTGYYTIFKDGVNVVASQLGMAASNNTQMSLIWTEVPGDTSPHTFTVYLQAPNADGNVYWGGNSTANQMIAQEVH